MSCLSLIHDLGHYLAYTLIFIFALGFKTFRLSCSVARPIPKQGFTRFLIFMLPWSKHSPLTKGWVNDAMLVPCQGLLSEIIRLQSILTSRQGESHFKVSASHARLAAAPSQATMALGDQQRPAWACWHFDRDSFHPPLMCVEACQRQRFLCVVNAWGKADFSREPTRTKRI